MNLKRNTTVLLGIVLGSVLFSAAAMAQEAAQPAANPSTAHSMQNDPELKAAQDEAIKKFQAADFEGALNVLKALYQKRPEIVPPQVVMAVLYSQARIARGVLFSLERATMETPNDPEAYILLAEISLGQNAISAADLLLGKAEGLLAQYNANAERKKNLTGALLRFRAQIAEKRGNWELVQQSLVQMGQIQGETSPLLLRQMGVALFQQKKEAEAHAMFDKAYAAEPADKKGLPADATMCQLYQMRGTEGDKKKSRDALELALKAYPKSVEVLALAVMARLGDYDLDAAKTMVTTLYNVDREVTMAKNPDATDVSDNTQRLVALVSLYRGEWAVAEQYFQKLVVKSPNDLASVNGLALALCEQGDQEKLKRAVEYAASNVQKNENNREFLSTLGWILYKAGQKQQAVEVLRRACADGQLNTDTAYYLAKISMDEKNTEQARRLLEAALKNDRPFYMRGEAEKLLQSLPAAAPAPAPAQ